MSRCRECGCDAFELEYTVRKLEKELAREKDRTESLEQKLYTELEPRIMEENRRYGIRVTSQRGGQRMTRKEYEKLQDAMNKSDRPARTMAITYGVMLLMVLIGGIIVAVSS